MNLELFKNLEKAQENRMKNIETGFNIDSKAEFKMLYNFLNEKGFNTYNLVENLKTLQLYKRSQEETKELSNGNLFVVAFYSPEKNRLEYSDWDVIGHELSHVASSNGSKLTGVEFYDKKGNICGKSFTEGISDYIWKKINSKYQLCYPLEKYVIEILTMIHGEEILSPYFQVDGQNFCNQFQNYNLIMDIIECLDCYSNSLYIFLENIAITDFETLRNNLKNSIKQIIIKLKKYSYLTNKIDLNDYNNLFIKLFEEPQMQVIKDIITNYSTTDFYIDSEIVVYAGCTPIESDKNEIGSK